MTLTFILFIYIYVLERNPLSNVSLLRTEQQGVRRLFGSESW